MRIILFTIVINLIFMQPSVYAQQNAVVAMVSDIQGQVMIEVDGEVQPCEILVELISGSKLHLQPESTLTLFYFESSEEYTFDSAGEVVVGEQLPQAASGNQPSSRNLEMAQLTGIAMEDQEGISLGLVKLRNIGGPELELVSPVDSKILNSDSEFIWRPIDDAQSYQFILSDDLGLTIADIPVAGTSLKLPEDINLEEGVDYTWEVVASLPSGTEYRAHAYFSVLEDRTREHVESTRPDSTASFAERAVYARMLERLELKAEASKIWRELALLRPDHALLQERIQ